MNRREKNPNIPKKITKIFLDSDLKEFEISGKDLGIYHQVKKFYKYKKKGSKQKNMYYAISHIKTFVGIDD